MELKSRERAPAGARAFVSRALGYCRPKRVHDFVAIGWMAPEGRSRGGLMIARVADGSLSYSGTVAAGVAGEKLVQLQARLAPQRGPTVRHPSLEPRAHRITWAAPTVAVRVAMRGWTGEGMLRNPSLVAVLAV